MRKKQGNADQGIAAVVQIRNDDSAIAFTANHGTGSFHQFYHIDFTHRRSGIDSTVFFSDIAQSPG